MTYSIKKHWLIFLLAPLLFTGCYTQFQAHDRFPIDDRYDNYYAWDHIEKQNDQKVQEPVDEVYYQNTDEEYLDQELALEQSGIYYKDFETEQWYKNNYADRYYWHGYDDGIEDGYHKGYDDGLRDSYYYGYTPWAYNSWYSNSHRYSHRYRFWLGTGHDFHSNFYFGFGYSPYYYGPNSYYGYYSYPVLGWDYWGPNHCNTHVIVYNNYHKSSRYSRNADLYRKGPRSNGLANTGGNRGNYGNDNRSKSRSSGINRYKSSTSSNNGYTRSQGSSSRGSNVGRSTGSKSRNTSVGRSRSGSNNNSRGNGTSVDRNRKGNSNNSSGKSRSRGNDGKNDSYTNLSARTISLMKVSNSNNYTYSIPSRRVDVNRTNRKERVSVGIQSLYNGLGLKSGSSSSYNKYGSPSTTRSSSVSLGRGFSPKNSGSAVRSQSSSNRSRASSSSSSSSKKRSRGGDN